MSIIIPAYNEESCLGFCLDAIGAQTEMPDEVIVVDNNSTDATAAIARRYPFVTLIREPEPGLIPARNAGFAHAHGDILGRINADAMLHQDWVARARRSFEADERLGGLTGPAVSDSLPYTHALSSTWASRGYLYWTDAYLRVRTLWGANMLLSRRAWEDIRHDACTVDRSVHEDQDLSLLLAGHGWRARCDKRLLIAMHGHDYHEWPKLREYMKRRWKTKRRHQLCGTLQHPGARLLPYRQTIPLLLLVAVPLLLFFGTSLLLAVPNMLRSGLRKFVFEA